MRNSLLFVVASALHLGSVLVLGSDVVLESLRGVPTGWRKIRDASEDQKLRLRVALQQPNTALFEKTLYDVSSPQHPSYGQHLSRTRVRSLLQPRQESTDAVLKWLVDAGVERKFIQDDGDWINFVTTTGQANEMLNTTFGIYKPDGAGGERIRALQYSVPEYITEHITFVAPIIRFGQIRRQRSHVLEEVDAVLTFQAAETPTPELNVALCNSSITPECLRALYNVGDFKSLATEKSLFGVSGYLEEWARYSELAKFTKTYAPYANDANFSVELVNGGVNIENDTAHDSGEANLDIQYAVAMSYKTPITYYSTGGRGPLVPDLDQPDPTDSSNEPYLDFLDFISALPDDKLPQTLTTSYGEDEQSVPRPFAEKVCQMFGALGTRGVSVIFSSGDTGVGSACQTNDGKNTTRFLPIFPAACPYLTSVGATQFVQPESAIGFSSGGFSDIHPIPEYQKAAVAGYLAILGDRWKGLFNPEGRGFPDVAAQGSRYHVFDQGGDHLISGTSASAPMFAALVQMLSNARLKSGKSPMGFLNPFLYSDGVAGLTDIVNGGSTGCTGTDIYSKLPTPFVPYASWNATKGWDPVTGLGTPLFDKLLDISNPGCEKAKIGA